MLIRCDHCFLEYDEDRKACPDCGHSIGEPPEELYYLAPGTWLDGRFSVGQVIGSGGFGIIYKAWDHIDERLVAVKEFFPSGLVTRLPGTSEVKLLDKTAEKEYDEGKQRFFDEAVYSAKFKDHPHIVEILTWFPDNNTAYYVMEYLPGPKLSKYLETKEELHEQMSVEESIRIILAVCDAVKAVHKEGILHRDISPDNIIIPPGYPNQTDGNVKLIDFGAARFAPDEKETLFTQIMKPGYSPPEQYESGQQHNEQVDIYALGATLYRIATGLAPEESTNRKIDILQDKDKLGKPMILNPAVPEKLSNVIMKAMAVDLRLRFRTVEDFELALSGKAKAIDPEVDTLLRKKKRKNLLLLATACLTLGLALAGFNFALLMGKENLPDASIQLWYILTDDAFANAAKSNALAAIAGDFMENYPNVSLELKGIEQEQYTGEVLSALQRGASPIVLETTLLDMSIVDRLSDVRTVVRSQNAFINLLDLGGLSRAEDCYFLNEYSRYFPEQKQIPLGFHVSAIYMNPELCDFSRDGVKELGDLMASMPFEVAEKGLAVHEATPGSFQAAYGGRYVLTDPEAFYGGQAGAYFADTSEFFLIREMMPARYRLLYVDSDTVPAVFTDLWGILPCSGSERKAAERLLQSMLGAVAQDHLYIQNQGGSLPINKRASEIFREVYSEYRAFFVNTGRYTFSSEAAERR